MIAIVLTGHMRTYERYYKYLILLKKCISADIYIHTWDDLDSMTTSSNPIRLYNKGKKIDRNKIIDLYKPEDIIIEEQNIQNKELLWNYGPQSYYGMMSCYYSWFTCYNLMENNNKKYNIVIKIRPDVYIYEKFLEKINNYINLLDEYDIVIFCMDVKNNKTFTNYPIGCDIFFMGKTEKMKILCNYYNHYDKINKNLKDNKYNTPEEVYWEQYVLKYKLKIKYVINYKKEWHLQQSYNNNEC